ncbi:putative quinol monooxygenase [Ruegeria atlantica]|uniref:putative quinol monooxygenase n=1 Tax=Ruegeria atlantica TaxID=81569 RepID=UPI00147E4FDE|nr:putative quinol monooxygenase [Ruegeria atlantica]
MTESKVMLTGHILVPADRIAQVRDALPDHISLTLAESGCISFDVTEDADIPGRFNVSEVFESQAAFDAHQARTKTSTWFKVTEGIPRDYQITLG